MADKTDTGYEPSKAFEEFYGTGNEDILNLQFRQLGRYLYNYELYGEFGLEIIEKAFLIEYLDRGKSYLEEKKDAIVRELKRQDICDKINSYEFKAADKLIVLFISSVVAQTLGVPIAISMTIAEIIAIYGVEKYRECDDA
jgi:hypothetical protein